MIRTLIVDDEPLPRERVRTLLAEHGGVEVIGECRDGREAVKAILDARPDLIFLDVQMPELDGFEVIEAVSAISPADLPAIVFVTAYNEYALRAFEVSALDYLLKPINAERFARAVRRALDRLARPAAPNPDLALLSLIERLRAEYHRLHTISAALVRAEVTRQGFVFKESLLGSDDVEYGKRMYFLVFEKPPAQRPALRGDAQGRHALRPDAFRRREFHPAGRRDNLILLQTRA
jgi:two-component system, LytTR family, response regulator